MPADVGDRSLALHPWQALAACRARRGSEPLVTYIDARSGQPAERTELSAITVLNGVAKIANALRYEFDLGPGSSVGLHLPWHWQRSLWWGGCAAIGARVVPYGPVDAVDLVACTPSDIPRLANGSADAPRLANGSADAPRLANGSADILVVSLHPLGLPIREPLPGGFVEATGIVRAQPDDFLPDAPGTSAAIEIEASAADLPGQRTLVACRSTGDSPASWLWPLALPLALEGSVVMLALPDHAGPGSGSADPDEQGVALRELAAQERAHRVVILERQP